MSLNQSADLYKAQRFEEGMFACEICGQQMPTTHRRKQLDRDSGLLNVGLFCCYEPEGGSGDRDLRRVAGDRMAAVLAAKEARQTEFMGEFFYGVQEVPDQSFVTTITPNPIVLIRGGAAVPVILGGNNFASSDTILYGGAGGITDAAPPNLVSSTQWDLNVQASIGMQVGLFSFTFNGTVWPSVFQINK